MLVPCYSLPMKHAIQCTGPFQEVCLSDADNELSITARGPDSSVLAVHISPSDGPCSVSLNADIAANTQVTLIVFSAEGEISLHQKSTLADGATLNIINITLGSKCTYNVQNNVGAHAVSNVDWIVYARSSEVMDLSVVNSFEERSGGGEITVRGVAEDRASLRIDGLIDIGLQGGGTDTYLTEEILMLDDTCKVDAIPRLEIKTNDVKASHSATVSKVTEADLFYFESRGIAPREARHMYIVGFLEQLVEKITHDETRDKVVAAIEEKYQK